MTTWPLGIAWPYRITPMYEMVRMALAGGSGALSSTTTRMTLLLAPRISTVSVINVEPGSLRQSGAARPSTLFNPGVVKIDTIDPNDAPKLEMRMTSGDDATYAMVPPTGSNATDRG